MATGTINNDRFYTVVNPVDSTKKLIHRITKQYASTTFGVTGYATLDTIHNITTGAGSGYLDNYTFIGMMIQGFGTGDVYGLARGSDPNNIYAIGKPNATVTFSVQYFFANSGYISH